MSDETRPYAQKHYIERYDRAERERRAEDARKTAEKIKLWTDYKTRQLEAHAEAKRKGEPPPTQLPHPDDVLIDEKGVRIVGPINADEMRRLEETLRYRDALFLQDALDDRRDSKSADGDQSSGSGSALLLLISLNETVPERFRLSNDEIQFRALRYSHMSKRKLLKQTYAALRAAGIPARRGARLPPPHLTKAALEAIYDYFGNDLADEV